MAANPGTDSGVTVSAVSALAHLLERSARRELAAVAHRPDQDYEEHIALRDEIVEDINRARLIQLKLDRQALRALYSAEDAALAIG